MTLRAAGPWVLLALCLLTLGAHAALLPLARWYPDEYIQFALFNADGWGQLRSRILGWSPRPLSEALLFGLSRLVALADAPLTAPALAVLWTATLAGLCLAARVAGLGWGWGLVFAAAALLVANPAEVWFWPAASAAYLPAMGGIGAAALLMAGPARGPWPNLALCLALAIAAASVEMGALFVLALAGLDLARRVVAMLVAPPAMLVAPLRPDRPFWPLLPPALIAAGVTLVLLTNRVSAGIEVEVAGGIAGNWLGSLKAAVPAMLREVAGVPVRFGVAGGWPVYGVPSVTWGVPVKLALLAGLWLALPGPGSVAGRVTCALGGLALAIAGFVTIVFAYRQFGVLCCSRHEGLRQAMMLAGLVCLASALPRPAASRGWVAPWLAAGVLGLLLAIRAPAIRADLATLPAQRAAVAANWESGRAPGDAMVFDSAPPTRLAGGWPIPPGTYRRETRSPALPPGMNWHVFALMLFFDKLELRAR